MGRHKNPTRRDFLKTTGAAVAAPRPRWATKIDHLPATEL